MKGRGKGFLGYHILILAAVIGLASCAGTPPPETANSRFISRGAADTSDVPPPAVVPEASPGGAQAPPPGGPIPEPPAAETRPPSASRPETSLSRPAENPPPETPKAVPIPPPDLPDTGFDTAVPAGSRTSAELQPREGLPVPPDPPAPPTPPTKASPVSEAAASAARPQTAPPPPPPFSPEKTPPPEPVPQKEKAEARPPTQSPRPAASPAPGPETAAAARAPASETQAPSRPAPPPEAVSPRPTAPQGKELAGEIGRVIKVFLPGLGWIFLGDDRETGKIRYHGKEFIEGATVFSFLAYDAGNYTLRFQQQDLAAGVVTYDSVKLAVAPQGGAKTAQALPSTASQTAAPAKPVQVTPSAAAAPPAAPDSPKPAEPPTETIDTGPEDRKFRRLLEEGRIKDEVTGIENFVEKNEENLENLDEWYFKLGRFFETDPVHRDIKKALWYYDRVRTRFPLSLHWDEANRRGAYIRRNFFEIR